MREKPIDRTAYNAWQHITTRWADNDVYGHVNNVIFYSWFDTAVNSWLVEQDLLDIAKGNLIGLVVSTRCSYFEPLAFPQEVEAGIAIGRVGSTSVTYRVGIFAKGSARAAAQGEFTHVYVDRESRRPVPLPPDWRMKLETIA